jgi:hypothetical protein
MRLHSHVQNERRFFLVVFLQVYCKWDKHIHHMMRQRHKQTQIDHLFSQQTYLPALLLLPIQQPAIVRLFDSLLYESYTAMFLNGALIPMGETHRHYQPALAPELASALYPYQ